ncbi:MAG: hypothetical protein CMJ58_25600 [Planctomycetaceae bacterium]|nr:hypothetical protein [Planctomycetaceae bacterium]
MTHQLTFLNDQPVVAPAKCSRLGSFAKQVVMLYLLLDKSGSMAGPKITQLNYVMGELPAILLNRLQTTLAGLTVQVQVISFTHTATAAFPEPISLEQWHHAPLVADGGTSFIAPFDELDSQLRSLRNMTLAPCIILASDGHSHDCPQTALRRLLANPRAKHGVRSAVAIGNDADRATLTQFLSEGQPLREADNPEDIADAIVKATMASIQQSITPATRLTAPGLPATGGASLPSIIAGGLSPQDVQALRDAGIDPGELRESA